MVSPARISASEGRDDVEHPSFLAALLRPLLTPFLVPLQATLDFISSPAFLRASISTLLFFLVSSLLLAISTTAYLIFYYAYIPPISLSLPLYLQYGVQTTNNVPYAFVDIPPGTLVSGQPYEVTIDLCLPRTPSNLDAGVFMIDVRLLGTFDPVARPPETLQHLLGNITSLGGEGQTVLHHSRRPSMLRYRSRLLNLAREAAFAPVHLLGLRDLDTDNMQVKLWEGVTFRRGASNLPKAARVEIAAGGANTGLGSGGGIFSPATSSEITTSARRQIQIYSAGVTFAAQFVGLRYFIYNYRILSFVVFSASFYFVSIISMGLVWAWIGPSILGTPSQQDSMVKRDPKNVARSGKEEVKIKTEEEDDSWRKDAQRGVKLEDEDNRRGRGQPRDDNSPIRHGDLERDSNQGLEGEQEIARGETADDEDEEEDQDYFRATTSLDQGRSTGRLDVGDSGIGTMSEGGPGLVRRRSGRIFDEEGELLDRTLQYNDELTSLSLPADEFATDLNTVPNLRLLLADAILVVPRSILGNSSEKSHSLSILYYYIFLEKPTVLTTGRLPAGDDCTFSAATMNVFRVLADLSHTASKCILVWAIHWNHSAEGVSLLTQILYAVVFCARYLDLFWVSPARSIWNFVLKNFYIWSSFYIIYVMMRVFARTREREKAWKLAAYALGGSVLATLVLGIMIERAAIFHPTEFLWVFSLALESVCVLPQLLLLRQTTVPTVIDSGYLIALGSYRLLYLINWIYRMFTQNKPEAIPVIFGVVQTALYLDFAWVYWTRQRVKLRGGGVVDSDDLRKGFLVHRALDRSGQRNSVEDPEAQDDGPGDAANRTSASNRWGARGVSVSADDTLHDHHKTKSRSAAAGSSSESAGMLHEEVEEDNFFDDHDDDAPALDGPGSKVLNSDAEWRDDDDSTK